MYDPAKRLSIFIAGPPECGKSTFISHTVANRLGTFPDRKVYLFTAIEGEDISLEGIEDLQRIKMIPAAMEEITLEKLRGGGAGSICIFDDIDAYPRDGVGKKCLAIMKEILLNGRDHTGGGADIDILITNHVVNEYIHTKSSIENCMYICLFPFATPDKQVKLLLHKFGVEN